MYPRTGRLASIPVSKPGKKDAREPEFTGNRLLPMGGFC